MRAAATAHRNVVPDSGESRTGPIRQAPRWPGCASWSCACDEKGNIDVADLEAKAEEHAASLACAHGDLSVDARRVRRRASSDICAIVHEHGGQVYMDGANMNAQVGLCQPRRRSARTCAT